MYECGRDLLSVEKLSSLTSASIDLMFSSGSLRALLSPFMSIIIVVPAVVTVVDDSKQRRVM
eukprot:13970-Heterococcus_DN1.PRE.1